MTRKATRFATVSFAVALLLSYSSAAPAPLAPAHNGKAYWFTVAAQQEGTFTCDQYAQQLHQDVSSWLERGYHS